MKRTILSLALALCSIACLAQFQLKSNGNYTLKFMDVSDPELLWNQFEEKDSKSVIEKNKLVLESRKDKQAVVSCAEFSLNPEEEDFFVEFIFKPSEIKDVPSFGIAFDYKNENNFSVISFGKKGYAYSVCEKGEYSVVKRGMYKLAPHKKNVSDEEYAPTLNKLLTDKKVFDVALVQSRGQFYLVVNDVEIARFKSIKITNPNMGFFTEGKSKLEAYAVLFSTISYEDDSEMMQE